MSKLLFAPPNESQSVEPSPATQINTGGGAYIGGGVSLEQGKFIGRDNTVVQPGGIFVETGGVLQQIIQPGAPCAISVDSINMAPKPPDNFVARPKEYDALKCLLLTDGDTPVAITAALRGAGGYGKTTLAQALCHDPEIITHFPDGILWKALGQTPGELTGHVLDLVEALTSNRPQFKGLDAATAKLIDELDDKKLLLVIDDVWDTTHLKPFLQGGAQCTRLITTRNDETLPVNTQKVDVDAMRSAEAVQLLAAGLAVSDFTPAFATLAARLGEWPLLLNLANGVLRRRVLELHQPVEEAIDHVQRTLTKGGITKLDLRNTTDRSQAVSLTIDASLALLRNDEPNRFRELAIFPEDIDIPLDTITRLWSVTGQLDDLDTEDLCDSLHRLSLLLRFDPSSHSIRLHDVIRTYLREQCTDLPALNQRFLATYALSTWTSLADDDPYLWNHLAYHLLEAERYDDLRSLFMNDGWLNARVAHDDYSYDGYIADLMTAWGYAHTIADDQIDAGNSPSALADCIRYALIYTTINQLSGNYEPALVIRALETDLERWHVPRALSVARHILDPERRAVLLTGILQTGKLNHEQRAEALALVLEVLARCHILEPKMLLTLVSQFSGEHHEQVVNYVLADAFRFGISERNAQVLVALVPQLSGKQREQALVDALEATYIIDDAGARVKVLVALAPQLSSDLLARALADAFTIEDAGVRVLEATHSIEDAGVRALVLAALVPQLSGKQRKQAITRALSDVRTIKNVLYRVQILIALVPQLSGRQREQASARELEAALVMEDVAARALVLAALVPQLSGEQREQAITRALADARTMKEEWARAKVLVALAPQLSGDLLARALGDAFTIKDAEDCAWTLVALTPQLSSEQCEQVIAHELDAGARALVLAALGAQLSGEQREQAITRALADARTMKEEWDRVHVLVVLAPQLSGDLLARALADAFIVEDLLYRSRALAALAPQLSGEQCEQAITHELEMALVMEDVEARALILATLVLQLSGKQREQAITHALAGALIIKNVEARAKVLAMLAPHLSSDDLLARVLGDAFTIEDPGARVKVLVALVPKLNGKQREQAIACALADALTIKNVPYRVQVLAPLAPQLSGEQCEQAFARALADALTIRNLPYRVQVLVALAPQLSGKQHAQAVSRAFADALTIKNLPYRVRMLVALAPQLNGEQRAQAFIGALTDALAIDDARERVQVLVSLAPQLSSEQRAQAFTGALTDALAIDDAKERVQVLAQLLVAGTDREPAFTALLHALNDYLWRNSQQSTRATLLDWLTRSMLFTPPIVDQPALTAIAGAIIDICWEWHWL